MVNPQIRVSVPLWFIACIPWDILLTSLLLDARTEDSCTYESKYSVHSLIIITGDGDQTNRVDLNTVEVTLDWSRFKNMLSRTLSTCVETANLSW